MKMKNEFIKVIPNWVILSKILVLVPKIEFKLNINFEVSAVFIKSYAGHIL